MMLILVFVLRITGMNRKCKICGFSGLKPLTPMDSGHVFTTERVGTFCPFCLVAIINFMCIREENIGNIHEIVKELKSKREKE